MPDTTSQTKPETQVPAPLLVTKGTLKGWSACGDGYRWFLAKFPDGAAYPAVMKALRDDNRHDDMRWLTKQAYRDWLARPGFVQAETATTDEMVQALVTAPAPSVDVAGDPSGSGARIGSSGSDAQIGSSGSDARIGSSGYAARIGSSGNDARIEATGANAVVAVAGQRAVVTLGEGGCAALAWHDGIRTRFLMIYVGEDGIEADVAYTVRDGNAVRAEG